MLSLIFGTLGCQENQAGRTEDGKIRVLFWHAMPGKLGETLVDMVKRFNHSHPKIQVEAISMGSYDTLTKKLLASIIAKTYPDIAQNFEPLTQMFLEAKKIVPLDEFINQEKDPQAFKKDIVPSLMANNTYQDKLWSMPFNKSLAVIFYNKEHFKMVGLDPDKPPVTWEQFADYGRKLNVFQKSRSQENSPLGVTKRNGWLLESMILQKRGLLIDPTWKKTLFDSKPAVESALFLLNLKKEGLLFPSRGYEFQDDFMSGKNSIIITSVVSRSFMEERISFSYGIAPLPHFDIPASVLSGTNVNIFKRRDFKRVDAAWTFLKWFTDTEQTAEWSLKTTYMPVRISAVKSEAMQSKFKQDPNSLAAVVQLDYAAMEPRITEWFEIRQILDNMVDNLFSLGNVGSEEVQKLMNQANNKATLVLEGS